MWMLFRYFVERVIQQPSAIDDSVLALFRAARNAQVITDREKIQKITE
jgi:hypothetical protein